MKTAHTIEEYDLCVKALFDSVKRGVEPEVFKPSPELQVILTAHKAAAEEKVRRDKVASLRFAWGAPKRHLQCEPVQDGPWGAALSVLKPRLGNGLLAGLVGGRGTGKTQIAIELMKCSTENLQSARFCTAMEFFMQVKATYGGDSQRDEASVLKQFQAPALLVIDEAGKRGGSDWENNLLFEVVNRRYNDLKDTILIDNRTREDFIATTGPSLASRMNECGGIIECNWKSFR